MNFIIFASTIILSTLILSVITTIFKGSESKVKSVASYIWVITIASVTIWFLMDWQNNFIDFIRLVSNT